MKEYQYTTVVDEQGRISLSLPRPPAGTVVDITVMPHSGNEHGDLIHAASTSLKFWDNPIDDETWNDA